MPPSRGLSFSTPMRVVDRIHRYATIVRTTPQPARSSRLTPRNVSVIHITDLPDRRRAIDENPADLARGKLQQCITALF